MVMATKKEEEEEKRDANLLMRNVLVWF